jgi:excisionase family DNA binding protein
MKRAYTSGEAAQLCGLSLSTVKRWIRRGALRAYRTPGGDLRIPAEQLHDFMREYDIPLAPEADESPRVLVAVPDRAWRRRVCEELDEQFPAWSVEVAADAVDYGFRLGRFSPWAVVLQECAPFGAAAALCQQTRELLAPKAVRIGLIGPPEGLDQGLRPEACLDPASGEEECDDFLIALLGEPDARGRGRRRTA